MRQPTVVLLWVCQLFSLFSLQAGLVESTNSFFQKPVLEPRPAAKPKTRPMLNKANIHEVHQPRWGSFLAV